MCDVKEFLFFVIYFILDLILAGSNFGEIFNNLAITFFHGGIDIVNHMLAVLPPPLSNTIPHANMHTGKR